MNRTVEYFIAFVAVFLTLMIVMNLFSAYVFHLPFLVSLCIYFAVGWYFPNIYYGYIKKYYHRWVGKRYAKDMINRLRK